MHDDDVHDSGGRPAAGGAMKRGWAAVAAAILGGAGVLAPAIAAGGLAGDPAVFDGPPAAYQKPLETEARQEGEALRTFSVEERAGVERREELVRAPVFFAAGECKTLDELAVIPAEPAGGAVVPWQADDVRRGPDGGIARVHVWFAVDLAPNQKKTFLLVKRPGAGPAPAPAGETEISGTEVRMKTAHGGASWSADGGLREIERDGRKWSFGATGALPRAIVHVPAKDGQPGRDLVLDRTTPGREVAWGVGALFTKIHLRLAQPGGVALEQDVRVPRNGRDVIVTTAVFPGEQPTAVVKEQRFLEGRLEDGQGVAVQPVPAGIRYPLRGEHAYTVTAVTRPNGDALLAVPCVIGGANGTWKLEDGARLTLQGDRGLQRGNEGEKATLQAYWSEVRLVPAAVTDADSLWAVYREHVQPLVAVVDEPGADVARLHAALAALAGEMKPIGWRQEAGRLLVFGQDGKARKALERGPQARESDAAVLVAGARNAQAKLTNNGARKLREDEKGRAYGGLDPYHITYTQSAAAALAVLMPDAPPGVNTVNLAMARGVRQVGGKVDEAGNPYIDCFSRTLNMQMGPVLFGLTAGAQAGDAELVRFYRDLATSPPVLGVFGRGQRPYTGAPAKTPDATDYLYQSICDFWLRTTELLGRENLGLHPLAYGRYTDCIDVMADRYHGVLRQKPGEEGEARANFFRGQAHTHRWLGWSASPFIRLLEDPAEHGSVGLTEAIRYADLMKGRWKNWPDLTFYILADLLVRQGLDRGPAPELLPAPTEVRVQREGGTAVLTWGAVKGASGYRVFRSDKPGGPVRWLNSPYLSPAPEPVTGPTYRDPQAPAEARYTVITVDDAGRPGAWPER